MITLKVYEVIGHRRLIFIQERLWETCQTMCPLFYILFPSYHSARVITSSPLCCISAFETKGSLTDLLIDYFLQRLDNVRFKMCLTYFHFPFFPPLVLSSRKFSHTLHTFVYGLTWFVIVTQLMSKQLSKTVQGNGRLFCYFCQIN